MIARNERFLRLPEVRIRVPYSRASIYRLISSGEFPRPYSLGARAVAWRESEIERWIADRLNGQRTPRAVSPVARLGAGRAAATVPSASVGEPEWGW